MLAVSLATYFRWWVGATAPRSSADVAIKGPDVSPRSAVNSGNGQAVASLPSALHSAKPAAVASHNMRLTWSDPLDQQIDRAGQAVVEVSDDSLASASGAGLIQYRLEDIREGIDEGPF
jgi:hypothetical protein